MDTSQTPDHFAMPTSPSPSGITSLTVSWDRFVAHLGAMTAAEWALSAALSLAVLAFGWAFRKAVHAALIAGFARMRAATDDAGRLGALDQFESLLRKGTSVALALVGALVLAEIWGFPAAHALVDPALLGERLLSIGLILLLAALAWRAIKIVTDYLLAPRVGHVRPAQDARTRTATQVIVGIGRLMMSILAALLLLSELGVNIAPLIAGAGIVGLAVGFGAQSLVKDILTGLMILIEDSIAVDDVVRIGTEVGKVERLGVRTLRLRAVDGTLHIIPYGGISVISNMTKDYGFAMLDVAVAYLADVEQVIALVQAEAEALALEPEFAGSLVGPVDMLGVQSVVDGVVTIRARIKTRPGERWKLERAFNLRIKRALEANNVPVASPPVTLYRGKDAASAA